MMRILAMVGCLAGMWAATASAQTKYYAPEDNQPIVERTGQEPIHYLEFIFERPRWVHVKEKGPEGKEVDAKYLYMPYKVVNYGKSKIDYRPSFALVTSTGREYRSQSYLTVFEQVKKELKRDYFISQGDLNEVGVPEGEENARYSVAIFKEFDSNADWFDIHVGNLTNYPPQRRKNPLWKADQKDLKVKEDEYFILSRQLKLRYDFPGYPGGRDKSWPSLDFMQWGWR